MKYILHIQNIVKWFHALKALDEVSISLNRGLIHGLIGPNGSGKSTLLNIIRGIIFPNSGRIIFEEKDITKISRHGLTKLGISGIFQNCCLFPSMSIINNIISGMHSTSFGGILEFLIKPIESNKKEGRAYQNALDYLDFVGIDHKFKDVPAMETPHVIQRHAELARAIASSPKLLLLDEPVSGLNDTESRRFQDIIRKIRDKGVTIFLVEHDMKFVSGTADEITVLNFGKKIAEGSYKDIRTNKEVIDAYLGEGVE